MPYEIRYRPGASRASIVYYGHLSGGDVAQSYEDLTSRLPDSLPRLSVLHDARGARSVVAVTGKIWHMVRALKALQHRAPSGRAAYVGGRDHPMLVGVVRLVLKLVGTSSRERRVFTDHDAARAWLDEGLSGLVPPSA